MHNGASLKTARLAAILIGLLPAWMILLPLDITANPEGWQVFVRANSFAVPLVQFVFVLMAMSGTFSPFLSIKELPRLTQVALALWLAFACIVSFQAGKDHLSAIIGLLKLAVAALFILALIEWRKAFGPRFSLTLWVSIGSGVLLYIALWACHIWVVSPQRDDWVTRIPGVNNVRHTGHFAVAGVLAGLVCLIAYQNRTSVWLRWVVPLLFGSVGLGLALWTGSRGPLLASCAAIFVTFCTASKDRKAIAAFFAASALVTTAVVATLPVPHPIYGIAGATGMADVTAQDAADPSSGRVILWSGTIDKIIERPILGWGVNQFVTSGPSKPVSLLHPHNFPLQLMFSGGLVGIILTLLIFFPALRQWKWPYIRGTGAAGVGGVVGILLYSLYDGALYFSYPTMIFLVAIATSIAPPSAQIPGRDMSD